MGRLPESFTQWDLADNQGLTVAHEAALLGLLPKDFDRWELATHSGVTVAFFAALSGTLPVTFDKWELLGENEEDFKERYLSAKKRH
jgi:hypothetical protein